VTVTFAARDGGTEVTVVHVRIADERARTEHAAGWSACLDRLAGYVSARPALSPAGPVSGPSRMLASTGGSPAGVRGSVLPGPGPLPASLGLRGAV
jgi:hypothetical protein